MSYNEYTWQTGETITAEKLNNIEEGVQEALAGGSGSAGMYIAGQFGYVPSEDFFSGDEGIFERIVEGLESGRAVYVLDDKHYYFIQSVDYEIIYGSTLTKKITAAYIRNFPATDSIGSQHEWIKFSQNDRISWA